MQEGLKSVLAPALDDGSTGLALERSRFDRATRCAVRDRLGAELRRMYAWTLEQPVPKVFQDLVLFGCRAEES
jgi:hypothetical protein